MVQDLNTVERRTSADDVFDFLFDQINTLQLLPGTRISEVEIARQFQVSRQPVREAFIRLSNLELLLIRPQKATVVRQFSHTKILRARFIRSAVETEVLRRACAKPLGKHQGRLERNLDAQRKAIADQNVDRFHQLDYDFHKILCAAADSEFVFQTILENKVQVDRLCMLSLQVPTAMDKLLQDHINLFEALVAQNEDKVLDAIRFHLSRLDGVIAGIRKSHADYFED